jgi:hypothetical protein
MKLELFEAILHTCDVTAEQIRAEAGDVTDDEIQGYLKILAAMDGQKAIVAPSFSRLDEYDYMGLLDPAQAKEVAYLMEQDPFMGCYIDQREDFDRDYDSGDYCPDGTWTLKKEYVKIIGPIGAKSGEGDRQ